MNFKKETSKYRYERKFIIPASFNNLFKNFLFENENQFKKLYSPRIVNSIYYDTHNLKLAFMNLKGDKNRMKIRLRHYGDNKIDKPSLEIKKRNGNLGNKIIYYEIKFQNNLLRESLNTLLELNKINDYLGIEPITYFPNIMISYKRSYFLSDCKKFRLTYDENISYNSVELDSYNKLDFPILGNNNILEIKYEVETDYYKLPIFSKIPITLSRNSKYISGLQTLGMI